MTASRRSRHKKNSIFVDQLLAERQRIARDLHDTLGQSLSAVISQLDAADAISQQEPDRLKYHILQARHFAGETLRVAREAVWDLRASILEGKGISGALRVLAEQLADSGSTKVSFSCH